jgi:hypothetical protein
MQLVSDRLAAAKESKERVWKKIGLYYILTIFFSGVSVRSFCMLAKWMRATCFM